MNKLFLPGYVETALRCLEEADFQAFLVGGCVRDMILGRVPQDYDITTSARPDDIASLFEKTVLTGERFGTVKVLLGGGEIEITTFRSEGQYLDCRHPQEVLWGDDLKEDLKRRDFTMNALAYSPKDGVLDFFGGTEDIRRRVIRCVGDPDQRFSEDALRMLRAFRFRSQLDFSVDKASLEAIGQLSGRMQMVSGERIQAELAKILMSDHPEVLAEAIQIGLFQSFIGLDSEPLDEMAYFTKLRKETGARFAALSVLLAKKNMVSGAEVFLCMLRLDRATRQNAGRVSALLKNPLPEKRGELKLLMSRFGGDAVFFAAEIEHVLFKRDDGVCREIADIFRSGECFSLSQLQIDGDELKKMGISDGKRIGQVLDWLLQHVCLNPGDNSRDRLMRLAESFADV